MELSAMASIQDPLQRRLSKMYSDTKKSYDTVTEPPRVDVTPELTSLHRKLRIQKDRLITWGLEWSDTNAAQPGDIDESLEREGLGEVVGSVMSAIKEILHEAERMRYSDVAGPDPTIYNPDVKEVAGKVQDGWQAIDKARFEDLLLQLTTSIDSLYRLSATRSRSRQTHRSRKAILEPPPRPLHPRPWAATLGSLPPPPSSDGQAPRQQASSNHRAGTSRTLLQLSRLSLVIEAEEISSATPPPPYEPVPTPSNPRTMGFLKRSAMSQHPGKQDADPRIGGVPVFIDYAPFDPIYPTTGITPPMDRLEQLAEILSHSDGNSIGGGGGGGNMSSTGFDLRVLNLVGYFEEPEHHRFGLVYALPEGVVTGYRTITRTLDLFRPFTLLSVLNAHSAPGSSMMPPLEDRFRLAYNLATTFLHLHTKLVVHQDVTSNNIIFFRSSSTASIPLLDPQIGHELRRPYICSFDIFSDANVEVRPRGHIYRHPQDGDDGRPSKRSYRPSFDIYGLGLILLEVGLWMPLSSFWKNRYTLSTFKSRIQDIYAKKLASKCGRLYMRAVESCLTAVDRDLDAVLAGTKFDGQWSLYCDVVKRLEQCCALDEIGPPEQPPVPVELDRSPPPQVRHWDPRAGASCGTLKGHSGSVNAVASSPDGRRLASASDDETVRLWDPTTGASCGILEGHWARVNAVEFSPDGRRLASASDDETVRLWDPTTGASCGILEGHSARVNAVSFSPDGHRLASASNDKTVRLWDPKTGLSRGILQGHSGWVWAVAFSPDGHRLASTSDDKTIRLWDPRTGASRGILEGHSGSVNVVAFSPDGHRLATGSFDNTVRLWDPTTGTSCGILEGHSARVWAVTFSPDGRRLATGSYDKTARLWDPRTGASRGILEGHSGSVNAVAFSPDSHHLATGSFDNTVRLWDPITGAVFAPSGGGGVIPRPELGEVQPSVQSSMVSRHIRVGRASDVFPIRESLFDEARFTPTAPKEAPTRKLAGRLTLRNLGRVVSGDGGDVELPSLMQPLPKRSIPTGMASNVPSILETPSTEAKPTLITPKEAAAAPKPRMKVFPVKMPPAQLDTWHDHLLTQLERLMVKTLQDSNETFTIDLVGLGDSAQSARPTILVTCTSVGDVKTVLGRRFKFDKNVFSLRVRAGKLRRSMARNTRKMSSRPRRSGTSTFDDDDPPVMNGAYQIRPLCGASIGAYKDQQHLPAVSYGGVVMVDGEPYGMTVHHLLDCPSESEEDLDDEDEEDPPRSSARRPLARQFREEDTAVTGLSYQPSDDETYLSDSGDELSPASGTDGEDEDEDDYLDDESVLSDTGDIPGVEMGQGQEFRVTQPAMDDVGSDFFPEDDDKDDEHLGSHAFGSVYASSGIRRLRQNMVTHEIDWALLKVDDERLQPHNLVQGGRRYCRNGNGRPARRLRDPICRQAEYRVEEDLFPNEVAPTKELGNLEVHCFGRTSGLRNGLISPAMSSVRVKGRRTPSRSWHVYGGFGGT